ncbi:hypothetical protein [Streptomyces sp. NPDC004008]
MISFGSSQDAQNAAAWWNAGPGAEFQQPLAVACAHLMVTGDWVQQHGQAQTLHLLHQAYSSCPDAAGPSSPTPTGQTPLASSAAPEPAGTASLGSAQPGASAPAPTAQGTPTGSGAASQETAAAA